VFQIERLDAERRSKVCEEKAKEIEDKLAVHREKMHEVTAGSKDIEKSYDAETKASDVCGFLSLFFILSFVEITEISQ
jgi:hypothetical protein